MACGRIAARLPLLLAALLASACSAEVERTTVSFHLAQVASCPIRGLTRMRLTVAGDFPTRSTDWMPPGSALALSALAPDAHALSVDAQLASDRAAALTTLPSDAPEAPLLLLPIDVSCPLGDTLAYAPDGAAVAATPGGALLIAGGRLA